MKGNSDKCHCITSTKDTHQILVGNSSIGNSSWEKLLGVKIDSKLTFYGHITLKIYTKMLIKIKSINQRNTISEN